MPQNNNSTHFVKRDDVTLVVLNIKQIPEDQSIVASEHLVERGRKKNRTRL